MVKVLEKLAKKSGQPLGLLVLAQDGKLVAVAVSDEEKQSYFYCVERGSVLVENQQLSLFEEVKEESGEDAALLRAVRLLTAKCQVYTLDIKGQYGYYGWGPAARYMPDTDKIPPTVPDFPRQPGSNSFFRNTPCSRGR